MIGISVIQYMLFVFRIKFRKRVCMPTHAIYTRSMLYVKQTLKEPAKYGLPNRGNR